MEALEKSPTLADRAHGLIREAIVSRQLAPGQSVTERALADRLSVSPTPVREALRRLEQEGLIKRREDRTLYVVGLTRAMAHDAIYVEAALRGVSARFAADRVSDGELEKIWLVLDEIERGRKEDRSSPELPRLGRTFHALVDDAAGNEQLKNQIEMASVFDLRYRMLRFSRVILDEVRPLERALEEHRAIAAALEAGDCDGAEELARRHAIEGGLAYLKHYELVSKRMDMPDFQSHTT